MKTLRIIGMALAAIVMSVNFASCSDKDDEPGGEAGNDGGIPGVEKKLAEGSNGYEKYSFSYDSNGNISVITLTYNDGDYSVTEFTWAGNTIVEKTSYAEKTFTLENNLIKKIRYDYDYDDYIEEYSYNSANKLVNIQCGEDCSDGSWQLSWDKNKLVSMIFYDEDGVKYDHTITYGNQTCKGFVPFISSFVMQEELGLSLAHPELFGLQLTYLPTQIKMVQDDELSLIWNCTYTFDDEGYITRINTEQIEQITSDEFDRETIIFDFKWE